MLTNMSLRTEAFSGPHATSTRNMNVGTATAPMAASRWLWQAQFLSGANQLAHLFTGGERIRDAGILDGKLQHLILTDVEVSNNTEGLSNKKFEV